MVDLSACGTKCVIKFGTGDTVKVNPEDLAPDHPPISAHRFAPKRARFDLNGNLYTETGYTPIQVTLALVPLSDSDKKLSEALYAHRDTKKDSCAVESLSVFFGGDENKEEYEDGYLIDGDLMKSASAEGQITGGVYTFVFADVFKPRTAPSTVRPSAEGYANM